MLSPREMCPCVCSDIHPQTSLVRSKFVEALQNYQQVEQQYRTRYRQRVERQFKIGKFRCFVRLIRFS
jgi:t-SNARE complex subunit (syntaxin)